MTYTEAERVTHSQRLREIADDLEAAIKHGVLQNLNGKAASLRAAADWADRVPHASFCEHAVCQQRGQYSHGVNEGHLFRPNPCTCHHAEPAP